ncbi:FG-GAP and VCBS repeat-containing protein [Streptomyces sp. CAU 1734]|uniref:FG-GAP and VCBS repeat-containing protein n=1 Tax=Streptomyces sp. CAU 1734 TaxID=3140360 RepID=UPI00326039D4
MESRKGARTVALAVVIAVAGSAAVPAAFAVPGRPAVAAAAKPAVKADDFNGDGFRDVVVAAPRATVNGKVNAGYVAVLHGSATQPLTAAKRVYHQDSPGVPGTAGADDGFGLAVTSADLDRDGYADLVAGAPGEAGDPLATSGSLTVFWGGRNGLAGSAILLEGAGPHHGIGRHLAAGDFDGDGAPDIATVEENRQLRVLSGPFGRDGSAARSSVVRDDDDHIVQDLAAGDVNGDGRTDLAALRHQGDEYDARHAVVWPGTPAGPGPGTVVKDAKGREVEGGESIALGDIDKDRYADLVIGRPVDGYDSDLGLPLANGGMITYVPGSARGPVGTRARVLNQDSTGIPGVAEADDGFGSGLSVADIDGDGYADVSTGVPGETFGGKKSAGAVVTLRGGRSGLTGTGAKVFSQDTAGMPGVAEKSDRFGSRTRLTDTNGDGRAELIVSAVGENAGAGSVWVLRAGASGVTTAKSLTFGAKTLGMPAARAALGAAFNR